MIAFGATGTGIHPLLYGSPLSLIRDDEMLLKEAVSILHGVAVDPLREVAGADELLPIETGFIGVTLELCRCTPGTLSFAACDIEPEIVCTRIQFPPY